MEKKYKYYFIIAGILLFVIYIFAAAQPVPQETILSSMWIHSLVSTYPTTLEEMEVVKQDELIPFQLGNYFGYVNRAGKFTINQVKNGYVSLSKQNWAEYTAIPEKIVVRNPKNEQILSINTDVGYPLFLDNRIFLIDREQSTLYNINEKGETLWSYTFASPLTCIDAASGLLLAGSLDGKIEVLDNNGICIFSFEPSGSRLSIIVGCALSKDGSRIALVSGIDEQRFLFMENLGDTLGNKYRVIYHEFLGRGFRRPVHITFVDSDNSIAFERQTGLGLYDITTRTSVTLPLKGEIAVIDEDGSDGQLFIITSQPSGNNYLATIRYPGTVIGQALFKSEHTFMSRQGATLYIGGGTTFTAFEIDKK
ncbi:MAG: WD40 repeat domain-containing protein [Treponema sp.]|jgi:WD40 repeat protein|nr:WD40 repeat domain-containing protein [Treponema sp.]